MTAIRKEAIDLLERVPEDKLSFVLVFGDLNASPAIKGGEGYFLACFHVLHTKLEQLALGDLNLPEKAACDGDAVFGS